MGCEEFALFQQTNPARFIFLGKERVGEPVVTIHAPKYIFNDETFGIKRNRP
jgi:hypothetical protein